MLDPYEGLTEPVKQRAMQIATAMPDEFPESFAVFLAQEAEGDA